MLQPIYRLALRFSGNPADAEDAAQEVMIRLVTHLGSFEGRSRFTTWAYTVAVRHLMRTTRRSAEASVSGPENFAEFLDQHAADPAWEPETQAEYDELCADVRLSCTYGMLLCLSREQRVAYLLGDLLGFTDVEGADICQISRSAFRQRLAGVDPHRRAGERRWCIGARIERLIRAHGVAVAQRERRLRMAGFGFDVSRESEPGRFRQRFLARRDRSDREVETCQHFGQRRQPRDPLDIGILKHVRNLT